MSSNAEFSACIYIRLYIREIQVKFEQVRYVRCTSKSRGGISLRTPSKYALASCVANGSK